MKRFLFIAITLSLFLLLVITLNSLLILWDPSSQLETTLHYIADNGNLRTVHHRVVYKGDPPLTVFDYTFLEKDVHNTLVRFDSHQEIYLEPFDSQVILIGGSFTSGYGLEDQHTIAHQLQNLFNKNTKNKTRVHNLGVPGKSFAYFYELLLMEHPLFKNLKKNIPTTIYYLFPSFHFKRFTPSYDAIFYNKNWYLFPFFEVNDGQVEYHGSFRQRFRSRIDLIYFLYEWRIISPQLVRFLRPVLAPLGLYYLDPNHSDEKVLHVFNQFMIKLKSEFKDNIRVVAVPFPFRAPKQLLDEDSFSFDVAHLQVSPEMKADESSYFLPYDGHPSAKLTEFIAKMLYRDSYSH